MQCVKFNHGHVWEIKCRIITEVYTNSPTAQTTSVTGKLYVHVKMVEQFGTCYNTPKSEDAAEYDFSAFRLPHLYMLSARGIEQAFGRLNSCFQALIDIFAGGSSVSA